MAVNFTPTTLTSGFASVDSLNAMFTSIQTSLQDAVSRSGNGPNSLTSDLDMDGRRILNLPAPAADHEPARKIDLIVGSQGAAGADGLGVPAGGATGEVLTKASNADNDTEWAAPAGGGGGGADLSNPFLFTLQSGTISEFDIFNGQFQVNGTTFDNFTRIIIPDRSLNVSSNSDFAGVRVRELLNKYGNTPHIVATSVDDPASFFAFTATSATNRTGGKEFTGFVNFGAGSKATLENTRFYLNIA